MINKSDELFERILEAEQITMFTGAEISEEAGLSTIKSPKNIWNYFDVTELSSLEGFEQKPQLVWQWYQDRRKLVAKVGVNKAFKAISELQQILPNVKIITQNVDSQHQIAGGKDVTELRGNFFQCRCSKCNQSFQDYNINDEEIPHCPKCGGLIRPNVVWFNEKIDNEIIDRAMEIARSSDIFFMIGLYDDMYPTEDIFDAAKDGNSYIIEIRKLSSIFSDRVNFKYHGNSSFNLPHLLSGLELYKQTIK